MAPNPTLAGHRHTRRMQALWWVLLPLIVAPCSSQASTTHVCREPNGQTTYSQFPCAGADRQLQLSDARSNAQLKHSQDMRQREEHLAAQMGRERQREARMASKQSALPLTVPSPQTNERAQAGRGMPTPSRRLRDQDQSLRDSKPLRRPRDFRAIVPGSHRKDRTPPDQSR